MALKTNQHINDVGEKATNVYDSTIQYRFQTELEPLHDVFSSPCQIIHICYITYSFVVEVGQLVEFLLQLATIVSLHKIIEIHPCHLRLCIR